MSRLVSPSENLDLLFRAPFRQQRAGHIVEVFRKSSFSFDCARNGVDTREIATGIDASRWASGIASLRVYSRSFWSSGTAQLRVRVDNALLSPDSPGATCAEGTGRNEIGPITDATPTPTLLVIPLSVPFGPRFSVSLIFSQGDRETSDPQTIEIGLTLVGRRG